MKLTDKTRRLLADIAERVGSTFVQGAVGAFGMTYTTASLDDWSSLRRVGVATIAGGLAALAALAKSWAATRQGATGTASMLPDHLDPGGQ